MSTGQPSSGPVSHGPVLTRRAVLAGGAAAFLAACGGGGATEPSPTGSAMPSPGTTMDPQPVEDAVQAALEAAGLGDADLALTPQTTWPELLTGIPTDLLLVVTDDAGEVLTDPVDVSLVASGEVVAGPATTTWYPDDRLPTQGLHAVRLAVEDPATLDVVVATTDGARAGTAGLQALPPEESIAPAPGDIIPAMTTPTTDDPMGLEELCTREENCGLHDVSLDAALAEGPVVLCVSTPKFCATAICGPVLEDVKSVADSGDHDDYTFIHVEPYRDADLTETDLVAELELPTEPWTWILQPDGTIVERWPGPVLPALLDEALTAAAGGATTEGATGDATDEPTASPSPSES